MSDLVERLRARRGILDMVIDREEAADRIEELEDTIQEMRDAINHLSSMFGHTDHSISQAELNSTKAAEGQEPTSHAARQDTHPD